MTQTQNPLWTDLLGFEDLDFYSRNTKVKMRRRSNPESRNILVRYR